MYALALYRLNALDGRVPLACATITTVLGCVVVLPPMLQAGLLIALPASLLWLMRTTTNHARSFEDALRRIEEIEHAVNARCGEALLAFQSSHPSRSVCVGGRTGRVSIETVLAVSVLLLVGCVVLAQCLAVFGSLARIGYDVFVVVILIGLGADFRRTQTYRYGPRSTTVDPRRGIDPR